MRLTAELGKAAKQNDFRYTPQRRQPQLIQHWRARAADFGNLFQHQPIVDARHPALINRVMHIVGNDAERKKQRNQQPWSLITRKQIQRSNHKCQRKRFRNFRSRQGFNPEYKAVGDFAGSK